MSEPSSNRRRTIRSIAAPISPARIAPAPRWRADSARHRSRAMSARRRFRPANSIPISRARSASTSEDTEDQSRTAQRDHARHGSGAPALARPARGESARSPALPASNRSTIAARGPAGIPRTTAPARSGRRTGRNGRKKAKAAGASSSNPTSSRRATSRRRSTSWSKGVRRDDRNQVLLGVTGSGKTFTMAKVIEQTQRPALILAPNKTLAAQLYGEFRSFFPDNAVEYFVCYYDYYQPEAYVPRTDTYIEKESSINEQIDRMRHSATRALLERDDVIIVASVSCIYGIGSVETYSAMTFSLKQRRAARPARSCSPIWSRCNTSATTAISIAARSACAATPSRFSRRTTRIAPGACRCSATRSRRSTNSIR